MIESIIKFISLILLILTHYYLSTRNNPYFGAILPIAYIIFMGFFFAKMIRADELSSWLIIVAIGGLISFLSVWISGRETVKKRIQKELEKIEIHNL